MSSFVTTPDIARNRAIFLYHLRVNPDNVRQIVGSLKTSLNQMCATGLGCDAFNIPMTSWEIKESGHEHDGFSPYQALADKLGITKRAVEELYVLNDSFYCSFKDVARVAE